MKYFYFIFLLFFINPVYGLINIPNANTTEDFIYTNSSFIDTQYDLDDTDNFIFISVKYTNKEYPYNMVYSLKDSKNNTIKIYYSYSKINGLIFDEIIVNNSISINNVLSETNYTSKNTIFTIPFINSGDTNEISIVGNNIIVYSSLGLTGTTKKFPLIRNYFFDSLIVPNSTTNIIISNIDIKYRDNGISSIQYEIDNNYNSLNPIFKLLFIIFKIAIKILQIVSAGYLISTADYLSYQNYILEPLIFLDVMIDTILFFIHFVLIMGVLWSFSLISILILIFSLISTKDIYEGFEKFLKTEHAFLLIIIKPITWFYDKLILQIIAKLRGSA